MSDAETLYDSDPSTVHREYLHLVELIILLILSMRKLSGGRNHRLSGLLKERLILLISMLIVIISVINSKFLKSNPVLEPFLKQMMILRIRQSCFSLPSSPRIPTL